MTLIEMKYIALTDGIPQIAGTAIQVSEIVVMHVHNDSSVEWIAENYDLSRAQIHAALAYYYDHQAEIDSTIQKRPDLSAYKSLEQLRQEIASRQNRG